MELGMKLVQFFIVGIIILFTTLIIIKIIKQLWPNTSHLAKLVWIHIAWNCHGKFAYRKNVNIIKEEEKKYGYHEYMVKKKQVTEKTFTKKVSEILPGTYLETPKIKIEHLNNIHFCKCTKREQKVKDMLWYAITLHNEIKNTMARGFFLLAKAKKYFEKNGWTKSEVYLIIKYLVDCKILIKYNYKKQSFTKKKSGQYKSIYRINPEFIKFLSLDVKTWPLAAVPEFYDIKKKVRKAYYFYDLNGRKIYGTYLKTKQ
jgi:hypothetical protein